MNYFQYIPEELKNTILIYSRYTLIYQLFEELGLFTNYRKLLLGKYPKNGMNIIKYINNDYEYYYKYLDKYNFEDDTNAFVHRLMSTPLNKESHDVLELISRIHLEVGYGKQFELIMNKFPKDDYKYIVIMKAMIHFESNFFQVLDSILKLENKDQINFNGLRRILNMYYEYVIIFLLILFTKFNLNQKELRSIYDISNYDESYNQYGHIDDYINNYQLKIIMELGKVL